MTYENYLLDFQSTHDKERVLHFLALAFNDSNMIYNDLYALCNDAVERIEEIEAN